MMLSLFLLGLGCKGDAGRQEPLPFSLSHLDTLYREVRLGGRPAAVVAVYSAFPDYRPQEAPGEGFACVDDAARAAVLFLHLFRRTGAPGYLNSARRLLQFLLYMQADNGLFYNFIRRDLTINRTGPTSRAVLSWWTARALYASGQAVPVFRRVDPAFADTLLAAARRVLPHLDTLLVHYGRVDSLNGLPVPTWLLYGSGADATSVLMLGLVGLAPWVTGVALEPYIARLAEGIIVMQIADTTAPFAGAFRSWQTVWHGWGNSQARALLAAGALLKRPVWQRAAAREVELFYPRWIQHGFPREIRFAHQGGRWQVRVKPFPQIAYAIRPALSAAVELYRQRPSARGLRTIRQLYCWFKGNNPAGAVLWDEASGRGYDGIESARHINRNAGAESTLEALLSRLMVDALARQHPDVLKCRGVEESCFRY